MHLKKVVTPPKGLKKKFAAILLKSSEIESKYPGWQVHAEISESGWWNRDFESPEEAEARAARVCDWLCESISPQPGRHALIIHADFKYLLLRQLIEVQGGGYFDLREPLYNTGISHFRWANGRWDLCLPASRIYYHMKF